MYSWWWVRLSPETCRVKPLRRIKTQLLHLVWLISLLYEQEHFKLWSVHCSWCKSYSPSEDSRVPSTEARRGYSSSKIASVCPWYDWKKVATHWTLSLPDKKVLLLITISSPIIVTVLDCGSSLRTGYLFQKLAFICNNSIDYVSVATKTDLLQLSHNFFVVIVMRREIIRWYFIIK